MAWHELYPINEQPSADQIAAYIHNPLWEEFNDYLNQAYETKPKYSFSRCGLQPGWNIKYSKGGKSLCTLYPMAEYFIALVVVGAKEMADAEVMLPVFTEEVARVFQEAKLGNGAKWLMLEIKNQEVFADALNLIALRRKPKTAVQVTVDSEGMN